MNVVEAVQLAFTTAEECELSAGTIPREKWPAFMAAQSKIRTLGPNWRASVLAEFPTGSLENLDAREMLEFFMTTIPLFR
jgi:hypothetical protein